MDNLRELIENRKNAIFINDENPKVTNGEEFLFSSLELFKKIGKNFQAKCVFVNVISSDSYSYNFLTKKIEKVFLLNKNFSTEKTFFIESLEDQKTEIVAVDFLKIGNLNSGTKFFIHNTEKNFQTLISRSVFLENNFFVENAILLESSSVILSNTRNHELIFDETASYFPLRILKGDFKIVFKNLDFNYSYLNFKNLIFMNMKSDIFIVGEELHIIKNLEIYGKNKNLSINEIPVNCSSFIVSGNFNSFKIAVKIFPEKLENFFIELKGDTNFEERELKRIQRAFELKTKGLLNFSSFFEGRNDFDIPDKKTKKQIESDDDNEYTPPKTNKNKFKINFANEKSSKVKKNFVLDQSSEGSDHNESDYDDSDQSNGKFNHNRSSDDSDHDTNDQTDNDYNESDHNQTTDDDSDQDDDNQTSDEINYGKKSGYNESDQDNNQTSDEIDYDEDTSDESEHDYNESESNQSSDESGFWLSGKKKNTFFGEDRYQQKAKEFFLSNFKKQPTIEKYSSSRNLRREFSKNYDDDYQSDAWKSLSFEKDEKQESEKKYYPSQPAYGGENFTTYKRSNKLNNNSRTRSPFPENRISDRESDVFDQESTTSEQESTTSDQESVASERENTISKSRNHTDPVNLDNQEFNKKNKSFENEEIRKKFRKYMKRK